MKPPDTAHKTLPAAATPADSQPPDSRSERLSRLIVAVVTCLGALGLLALLYFPLRYLR